MSASNSPPPELVALGPEASDAAVRVCGPVPLELLLLELDAEALDELDELEQALELVQALGGLPPPAALVA